MPVDPSDASWPLLAPIPDDPTTPWRWLGPQDALACLREHGVMDRGAPARPDNATLPAQRRVGTIALGFLRMASTHELPATRYVTTISPGVTQAWWMSVLVQEYPNVRLALACALPWEQAPVMYPNGPVSIKLKALPTILMARSGQAFAEASVHASMTPAFVNVEQAIKDGALNHAWQAWESALLRTTLANEALPPIPNDRPAGARRRL